jgi:hypothetical protein
VPLQVNYDIEEHRLQREFQVEFCCSQSRETRRVNTFVVTRDGEFSEPADIATA